LVWLLYSFTDFRWRTVTSSYYRGSHGIIIVYDVTDKQTFDNVAKWLQEIDKYTQDSVVKILVGNKSDEKALRQVSPQAAKEFAKQHNVLHFETSAKNNTNVDKLFESIAKQIAASIQK